MAIRRVDHIAIVVPDIEAAQTFYRDALGLELTHVEQVDDQQVIVAFFPTGESEIELVEPITQDSGVARYLASHGPGVHHICLEVDDIQAVLDGLKARGVRLINEQPTIGSGGKRVAFIHPHSTHGVLIELYEETPEEPQRRAATLEELITRLDLERQAVAAGLSAFLRALRLSSGRVPVEGTANNVPRGITIKAEGEMIDTGDGE